jgi:hypothetical protein
MSKIYSYVLKVDDGAAPNPFFGKCTLTICKPKIRKTAQIGDWVIGTGSKNTELSKNKFYDFSNSVVYAMKVTAKMTLAEYDKYCQAELTEKIPDINSEDWRLKVGDCIYDYSTGDNPVMRRGVHDEYCRNTDLDGLYSLLSDHFYYFGYEARPLPHDLMVMIKKNRGHKVIINPDLVQKFEQWISQFERNKIYANSQRSWFFDRKLTDKDLLSCSKICAKEDEKDEEENVW